MHLYTGVGTAMRSLGGNVDHQIVPFHYLGESQDAATGWMFSELQKRYPALQGYTYSGQMTQMDDATVLHIASLVRKEQPA